MKVKIKDIFLGLQDQMCFTLKWNRKILKHPVLKGDASELAWVEMLSTYLPKRYQVEKAFVIDCKGNISEQIDIVIFDRHYSPFLLRQNGATYIPAESVYAVIEVKQEFTLANVKYAAKKAKSVRKLIRTNAPIIEARGKIDKTRKPFEILAGLLTLEGSINKSIEEYLVTLPGTDQIQFGCSLQNDAFSIDNKGNLSRSGKDTSLVYFFLNLLASLQAVGTVPAIEIKKYLNNLR